MAEPRPGLTAAQFSFAAYIRDPTTQPVPPGTDPRRMAMYRELFFNNIENFLASGFPVLKTILAGERWQALVQDFFARHRSQTPLFVEVGEEFLAFLQDERGEIEGDPPFLLELAHYEWVELALAVAEAEPTAVDIRPDLALLDHELELSGVAWPLAYRHPVHRIGPDSDAAAAPDTSTYLVVYRNSDDEVKFLEINPATFRWLQILEQAGPLQGRESLLRIARELEHPDPAAVLEFGESLIQDLAARGVLGARPPAYGPG